MRLMFMLSVDTVRELYISEWPSWRNRARLQRTKFMTKDEFTPIAERFNCTMNSNIA